MCQVHINWHWIGVLSNGANLVHGGTVSLGMPSESQYFVKRLNGYGMYQMEYVRNEFYFHVHKI